MEKRETRDDGQTRVQELKQEDNITPAQPASAADGLEKKGKKKRGPSLSPNTRSVITRLH